MDLSERWIAATERQITGHSLSEELQSALIQLYELVEDQPEIAIDEIGRIIRNAPSDRILHCLGAGPIEELLTMKPEYLANLDLAVTDKVALRKCLSHVNREEDSQLAKLLSSFLA